MSKKVQDCLHKVEFTLTPIALRLACQERITRWIKMSDYDHEFHKQNFFNRALVDCLYKKFGKNFFENMIRFYIISIMFLGIRREEQKRSVNRNLGNNLEDLVDRVIHRNNILDVNYAEQWKNELKYLYEKYQSYRQYIEPFAVSF